MDINLDTTGFINDMDIVESATEIALERLIQILQAEVMELRKQNIELAAEVLHLKERAEKNAAFPIIHQVNTPDPVLNQPFQQEWIHQKNSWETVTLDNSRADGWDCFAIN